MKGESAMDAKVTAAKISYAVGVFDPDFVTVGGSARADLTFDDGTRDSFAWYHDELTFTVGDFIGKTMSEIRDAHRRRDTAYLRS